MLNIPLSETPPIPKRQKTTIEDIPEGVAEDLEFRDIDDTPVSISELGNRTFRLDRQVDYFQEVLQSVTGAHSPLFTLSRAEELGIEIEEGVEVEEDEESDEDPESDLPGVHTCCMLSILINILSNMTSDHQQGLDLPTYPWPSKEVSRSSEPAICPLTI